MISKHALGQVISAHPQVISGLVSVGVWGDFSCPPTGDFSCLEVISHSKVVSPFKSKTKGSFVILDLFEESKIKQAWAGGSY